MLGADMVHAGCLVLRITSPPYLSRAQLYTNAMQRKQQQYSTPSRYGAIFNSIKINSINISAHKGINKSAHQHICTQTRVPGGRARAGGRRPNGTVSLPKTWFLTSGKISFNRFTTSSACVAVDRNGSILTAWWRSCKDKWV